MPEKRGGRDSDGKPKAIKRFEAPLPPGPLGAARPAAAKEVAVEAALDRLVPGDRAQYPDSPDAIVTAVRRLEAIPPQHAPFPETVDPRLRSVLAGRGIEALYGHQADAIRHSLAGRHVVLTTPTASGKTLCYNLPVLQSILQDPAARALYLFPTKALAQDQLAELDRLSQALAEQEGIDLGVFTYDGDTPQDARRSIRARAHVVLTNPDMLHSGILPHHPRWAKLFENLRFVVLDELHTYRGVFGSHLANVLRRLRRIAAHYGSRPQFICCSATIANPADLAERLTGEPFELVDRSGAPRGEKLFVFVNPPVVNRQLGIRRSYLAETRRVSLEFLRRNLQIIVFAQSRLSTEILTRYLKDATDFAPGASDSVRGYRGGYLPKRRREIEKGLRDGDVRAVVATNALELGIDIGALDVAVLAGYPGTIAATWQRVGRAGRRSGRSAAVMVASSAPLDQFIVRNPSYFFDASPEHALVNPDNLHILLDHIKCAAFELPFGPEERFGEDDLQEILGVLSEEGFVHLAPGDSGQPEDARWHWTSESYPADAVSLRSVSSDNFVVVDTTEDTRVIGETDFTSALTTLHPKAIYIVEGRLFQVEKLDFEGRKAYVRAVDCDYYTDAITYSRVTVLDCFASSPGRKPGTSGEGEGAGEEAGRTLGSPDRKDCGVDGHVERDTTGDGTGGSFGPSGRDDIGIAAHGEVHVVSRTVGFKKIKFYTNENVGSGELDLPEHQMHTTSFWLTAPRELMMSLPYDRDDRRDGVVGLAFAMGQVAQLLLMCDRHDIGISLGSADAGGDTSAVGRSGAASEAVDADHPRVFIYDNYPGGIGFSEPLFLMTSELVARTRDLIAGCPCDSGCPSCVGPLGETGPRAKAVALDILSRLPASALPGLADDAFPPPEWA